MPSLLYGAQRMALTDQVSHSRTVWTVTAVTPQISHETYIASGINTGTGLEQLPHHMIVSHLCCDPQRSGTIYTPGVWIGSLWQQEHEYLKVAILRCNEQWSGAVLLAHTQLCPVELGMLNLTTLCKTRCSHSSGSEDLCHLGCVMVSLDKLTLVF